ncbi:MAG: HAD hydrolase-like protein, partial [Sphaerospermopsis sp. SIO1G2]|nr:HAD hydrolase-like protein [Sphaerospermopsis sp. SIO1G2]
QEALHKLNCGPQDAIFIGDSLTTDIGGAKEAGLNFPKHLDHHQ